MATMDLQENSGTFEWFQTVDYVDVLARVVWKRIALPLAL
jgi:hypothetical protein